MAAADSDGRASTIGPEVRAAALRGEPDRYLAATLAPVTMRSALAALAAFAAETARIPSSVSEPMLGDIKLQWWRDAISGAERGQRSGHPVADALGEAMRRFGLDRALLEASIDAREFDLSGGLPDSDAALDAYLERIEGHQFRLALHVLAVDRAAAKAISGPAGRAYGLARALGRLPMLFHNGGLPLPADRMRSLGIEPAHLGELRQSRENAGKIAQIAAELREIALSDLGEVRRLRAEIPRPAHTALLPLAMVEPYFRAQSGRNLLDEMVEVSPARRAWRIGMAHLFGRI